MKKAHEAGRQPYPESTNDYPAAAPCSASKVTVWTPRSSLTRYFVQSLRSAVTITSPTPTIGCTNACHAEVAEREMQ